jgi:subtilase family serine protease
VLGALKDGAAPNLVVPADRLVLTPDRAEEGDVVRVTASVLNTGRRPADPTLARLYDGDPALGDLIQELPVAGLAPMAGAEIAFDYPTRDRPGDRTLYVVADAAGAVREAREDDNATSRSLNVAGLLPDLAVAAEAFTATPAPAEEGERVQIGVVVHNAGERLAAPSLLRVFDGDPRAGGTEIAQAAVPALAPGGSAALALEWDTAGSLGSHTLVALADAEFAVDEGGREANNRASLGLDVTESAPPGIDLAWGALVPDPPALETLPQPLVVRGSLRNLASDAATAEVALYDGDPSGGALLAQATVEVAGRSTALVSFDAVLATGGTRTLFAVADPGALVDELDEANNVATAVVRDPGDSFDLEVVEGGVVPSTAEPVAGELLEIAVTVANRGTARRSSSAPPRR